MIIIVSLLWSVVLSTATATATQPDHPYYQDVSHRSLFSEAPRTVSSWDVLPFSTMDSTLHMSMGSSDCFVSLSRKENMLYAASRNNEKNKLMLETPYNSWEKLFDLSSEAQGIEIVSAPQSEFGFFIITSDNVYGVRLVGSHGNTSSPSSCGQVDRIEALMSSPVEGGWGEVYAATASASSVWVSSSAFGLSRLAVAGGEGTWNL